jgi:predicted dehydrogenase
LLAATREGHDSIKDNPEVDVIYIVLPNGMHAEYTVRGLESRKHVLTEKPMANTPTECQQMIDTARKADRKLMVAYRCRYEPYNQEAIRIARAQELGPTQMIIADAGFKIGDPTQWRLNKKLAGGGSLMDIGIALNASRFLSGEKPTEVNAMISTNAVIHASKKWKSMSRFNFASQRHLGKLHLKLRLLSPEPFQALRDRRSAGDGSRQLVQRLASMD